MKSNRVSRIVQILTTLQAGKPCTADELAETFSTSRRTIFRDLKELQLIGIPYHYDNKTASYTIDPEFYLPPIDLNLQEALSLLLLVYKVNNQLQMPFSNSALLAALKIENNLPGKIKKYCNTSLKTITTRLNAQAPLSQLDKTFNTLQKAIQSKNKITLGYESLYEQETIETELSPYHLLYSQRAWYILGYSQIHKSIRTFKLNRIKDIAVLDKRFINGDSFDLNDYLGRAWSLIPEGRIYNIKLKFSPKVTSNVAEVQWHNTQKVTRSKDGSATIEFRVDGIKEIYWWVLGYGDQVQVIAPKKLRQMVVDAAKNIIKNNS